MNAPAENIATEEFEVSQVQVRKHLTMMKKMKIKRIWFQRLVQTLLLSWSTQLNL